MRGPGQPAIALTSTDAELDAAWRAAGARRWVRLHGAVPVERVRAVVASALAAGVQPLWVLDPADPGAADVEAVRLEGLPAVAVPVAAGDDAGAALLRSLPASLRRVALVPVTTSTLATLAQVAAVAADVGASVEAWSGGIPELPSTAGPVGPRAAVIASIEALWRGCAGRGVGFRAYRFRLPPDVPRATSAPPTPLGPAVLDALRATLPLPLGAGVTGEAEPEIVRLLGAVGWPVHEAPRCAGGLGRGTGPRCARCPGGGACGGGEGAAMPPTWTGVGRHANVHVVAGYVGDRVLLQSTLPGLVDVLRARGASVRFDSAWEPPHNPVVSTDDDPLADADVGRQEHARAHVADFARDLDLSGADLVVVAGWAWGEVVVRHPTLPPGARVVVADLHLLDGIDRWKQRWLPAGSRSLVTSWWPDPRVEVHACFPGYARLYWYAGVPLANVAWRPYPVHLPAFAPGPDPRGAGVIVAAGNHLRDPAILLDAARRVPQGRPIDVIGCGRPRVTSDRLRWSPPVPLPALRDRLAAARCVVVAVEHDPDKAAGISIVAIAQALGRPVIATATPATIDHVRHEVDGLLVPCGDGAALADALRRIDADDDLVGRLSEGALRAAARASTEAWADELLDGVTPPPAPIGGPFPPW